jgi:hypothetical protein
MKNQFQNLDIQCWEHTTSRLGKNRPFICLQAGAEACDALLAVLDELAAAGVPARRTLTLKPCQRPKACSAIRLLLSLASSELAEMSLTRVEQIAVFEFSSIGLASFRNAVSAWKNGGEDFCIAPCRESGGKSDQESGEVWFWTPLMEP